MRARGRWEIILDVLNAMEEEIKQKGYARKTRIMQKALLDWRTFQKHFNFLLEQGLIEVDPDDEKYYITNKGMKLLKKLREICDALSGESDIIYDIE